MNRESLERYLKRTAGDSAQLESVNPLGSPQRGQEAIKAFGFGTPLLVTYRLQEREERVVIHKIKRNAFGRERADDRAAAVWLDYETFNHLPRHVPALDKLMETGSGEIRTIAAAEDLLLVTAYRHGDPYARDLERLMKGGTIRDVDISRVEAMAGYLAEIHSIAHEDELLWRRRLRDLIGDGEGIMGLTDSYPADGEFTSPTELRRIETSANTWRWRLKAKSHRLRQVHGDFHPFNILFSGETEFAVLDRSRGAWGEPADDASCLSINYIFFSLQRHGELTGTFEALHSRFWRTYFDLREDDELLSVIQPWLAWRALVLASPVWYPDIDDGVRRKLLNLARHVMLRDRYHPEAVNGYLESL